MKDVLTRKVEIDDVAVTIAPQFNSVFTALLEVMEIQEEKAEAKRAKLAKLAPQASQASSSVPISSGSAVTLKRPRNSSTGTHAPPMKRQKSGYDSESPAPQPGPTTPNQTTITVDPNYTGDTAYSGDSAASKPEGPTATLLQNLITNTQTILKQDF